LNLAAEESEEQKSNDLDTVFEAFCKKKCGERNCQYKTFGTHGTDCIVFRFLKHVEESCEETKDPQKDLRPYAAFGSFTIE